MIRSLRKKIVLIAVTVVVLLCAWWGYRSFRHEHADVRTLPARAGEIKKMVKLSSLEIVSEEIFKDTVNIKAVVFRVKAMIYISFDIENMPMTERGDTLFIQLPREMIEVREATQNGYQVLDVWNVQMPNEPAPTPLRSDEENIIKRRLKERIVEQTYQRGYVKRARANALHSLATFFSVFRDNVVIIDRYPEGWKQDQQPPAPVPEKQLHEGLSTMP